VDEELSRRFQAGGQEKGGPVDAVKLEDVLADHLLRRWPVGGVLKWGKIAII